MNWGILALIFMSIFWGTGFAFAKKLILFHITPLNIIAYRFGISTLIVFLIFFKKIIKTNWKEILISCLAGIALTIYYIGLNYGLSYTTAFKAGFISDLYVVWTPFINFLIFKKKLNKKVIIAAILAVIGLALLSLNKNFDFNFGLGESLTLICGLAVAIQIIIISKYGKDINPNNLLFFEFLTISFLAFISTAITGEFITNLPEMPFTFWKYIFLLSFVTSIIPFLLQAWALKSVNPELTAILMSFECFFGAILSHFLLEENFTLPMGIGAIILVSAMILSQLGSIKNNN